MVERGHRELFMDNHDVPLFCILTGHSYTFEAFSLSDIATTIANLNAALNPANPANKKVVTALNIIGGGGLSRNHVYTVLGYNAAAQTVTVRNPWGMNDSTVSYNDAALAAALILPRAVRAGPLWAARNAAGNDIRGALRPGGQNIHDADFTMSLVEFTALFASAFYER